MAQLQTPALLLCLARFAVGSISLLAPSTALTLFQMRTESPAMVPTRLFGIREIVLSGLLYTSPSPAFTRRILIAGAVVDSVDIVSCALGVKQGDIDRNGAFLVGGGAVALVALAALGLRNPGVLARVVAKG